MADHDFIGLHTWNEVIVGFFKIYILQLCLFVIDKKIHLTYVICYEKQGITTNNVLRNFK